MSPANGLPVIAILVIPYRDPALGMPAIALLPEFDSQTLRNILRLPSTETRSGETPRNAVRRLAREQFGLEVDRDDMDFLVTIIDRYGDTFAVYALHLADAAKVVEAIKQNVAELVGSRVIIEPGIETLLLFVDDYIREVLAT